MMYGTRIERALCTAALGLGAAIHVARRARRRFTTPQPVVIPPKHEVDCPTCNGVMLHFNYGEYICTGCGSGLMVDDLTLSPEGER